MKILTDVEILGSATSLVVGTTNTSGDGSVCAGSGNTAFDRNLAVGTDNTVSQTDGIALGRQNTVAGLRGFAAGIANELTSNGTNGCALGNTNTIDAVDCVAIGNSNAINDLDGVAIGQGNTVGGDNSIVIGSDSVIGTSGTSCLALGFAVESNASNAIVIGNGVNSTTRLVNGVAETLYVGFNSTVPTLIVGPGSGAGTYGLTTINAGLDLGDRLRVAEIAAPSTPPSGFGYLYEKSDGKLYFLNDGATEYDLTATGSGGITRSIVVTSGSATMGAVASTDYVYLVAGAHTMTLPTAVGNTNLYTVKNNHSANITIDTTASQTIDGTTTISIAPEEAVMIISDNSNWSII